jgi:glycosyltransferase involved in cell wall biosynthesis
MNILHLTAHLGGGVGKAHAGLTAAMPFPARQRYLLLEAPRDRRYVDAIEALGRPLQIASCLEDVAAAAADADIVQFEFWNHPKLFECLARTDFPAMRAVFWCHISGLFRPVIQPEFLGEADRFVFTSPASLEIGAVRAFQRRERLAVIGGAYGFEDQAGTVSGSGSPSVLPAQPPLDAPICYLGTVDFVKMHPGFFSAIDALSTDVAVAIWGAVSPDVEASAAAMRHRDRIRFMGQTPDPRSALEKSRIFFYPLQPDHYGTGENALVEAMSLGLVPVVLANPAECAIVRQGQTGFIASSIAECSAIVDRLLADPDLVAKVGADARDVAASAFSAKRSAQQFLDLWSELMTEPKRVHDFRSITGATPREWFEATMFLPGEAKDVVNDSGKLSKGSPAHFRAAFPDDPSWG